MGKNIKYFFISLILFIIIFSFSTDLPKRHGGGFLSDESTYFSITQSLAYDFDLEYNKNREDINRIKKRFWVGPMGLFLKKAKDGRLYYAKSFAYPILASLFFRFFDVNGLLLFNGLMIFFSILMGYFLLRSHHSQKKSFTFSLIFVLATIVPVYIWWLTADLFNFFMAFAALFFFFYKFKKPHWFYLSAIFFSLAVFSKPSNILPFGIVFLILLFRKEWKKFILLSLSCLILLSGLFFFNYTQTGEINYQGGDRKTFYGPYPFEKPEYTFEATKNSFKMSADNYWKRLYVSPQMVILNSFYYFFGRFTGMFIYFFPAVFVLILFFFQKKTKEDWFILMAIFLSFLFFIIVTADNYFGGSGSVGNRYFLSIFPLFFFLGFKNRIFKYSLLPVFISIFFLSGTYMDSFSHSKTQRIAGLSFPIKLFPPEKTQYLCLPTNENFRAFGRVVRDGEKKYQIYFLNDNFWRIEEDGSFWTRPNPDHHLELFLTSPERVREFKVELENIPKKNRVCFQIEHKKKHIILKPNQRPMLRFSRIDGLKIHNKYLYYIKIKSEMFYCPYFDNPENKDRRILGLKVHISLVY